MKRSDASGTSLRSERSLVSSAVCFLGVLLGATACMQPPTQITVNANSSADKTYTNTENYSAQIESKESSNLVTAPLSQPRVNDPINTPNLPQVDSRRSPDRSQVLKGSCSFNNKSMPCTVMNASDRMTMIWSDGVTETYSKQGNEAYVDIRGGVWLNKSRGSGLLLEHNNGNTISFIAQ